MSQEVEDRQEACIDLAVSIVGGVLDVVELDVLPHHDQALELLFG
jgi:hypothetical protein